MQRHVLDRPTIPSGEWLREAIKIRRDGQPRTPSLVLQRRAREGHSARRLQQFLRIARGRKA